MKALISLLALGIFVFGSGPLLADNRVRTEFYSQNAVVMVGGRADFETSVIFNDDEKIENVAVGDSLAWQVTPNKRANLLFVKPILPNTRTNMTVVTDKRIYMFDLVPSTDGYAAVYSLRFQYPNDPISLPAPAVKAEARTAPTQVMNFSWTMKGQKKLFPAHICDDSFQWVKVHKLPPNTTSMLQPMDAGIIKTLKVHGRSNRRQIMRGID